MRLYISTNYNKVVYLGREDPNYFGCVLREVNNKVKQRSDGFKVKEEARKKESKDSKFIDRKM